MKLEYYENSLKKKPGMLVCTVKNCTFYAHDVRHFVKTLL